MPFFLFWFTIAKHCKSIVRKCFLGSREQIILLASRLLLSHSSSVFFCPILSWPYFFRPLHHLRISASLFFYLFVKFSFCGNLEISIAVNLHLSNCWFNNCLIVWNFESSKEMTISAILCDIVSNEITRLWIVAVKKFTYFLVEFAYSVYLHKLLRFKHISGWMCEIKFMLF